MKKWLFLKNIPISRLECKNHTLFVTKLSKISSNRYPIYDQNGWKTDTLWGRTYLYSPCKGVRPPTLPPGISVPKTRKTEPASLWNKANIMTSFVCLIILSDTEIYYPFPVAYRYYEAVVRVVPSDHFPVLEVSKQIGKDRNDYFLILHNYAKNNRTNKTESNGHATSRHAPTEIYLKFLRSYLVWLMWFTKHHSFCYFVGMNLSVGNIWAMGLKSKFSDVHIPQDLSWPQFVFQNFEANGSKTAIVSGVFKSLSYLNLFALVYCITMRNVICRSL